MEINTEGTIKKINFFDLFDDVINKVIIEQKLALIAALNFKCFLYNYSFRVRSFNQVIKDNSIIFDLDTLKVYIQQCYEYLNQTLALEVNQHSILTKFKERLEANGIQKSERFSIESLTLDLSKTEKLSKKINFESEVFICTQYILKKFVIKSAIPIELYLVLLNEVHLTYLQNKELYSEQTDFENRNFTFKIITQQYGSLQRKLNQESEDYFQRKEPPLKNDRVMILQDMSFDSVSSLSLICQYVGSNKWHKHFKKYDRQEKSNYYIFPNA